MTDFTQVHKIKDRTFQIVISGLRIIRLEETKGTEIVILEKPVNKYGSTTTDAAKWGIKRIGALVTSGV